MGMGAMARTVIAPQLTATTDTLRAMVRVHTMDPAMADLADTGPVDTVGMAAVTTDMADTAIAVTTLVATVRMAVTDRTITTAGRTVQAVCKPI